MRVEELRKYLNNLPDDMEIIIQKDAEGNSFSPLWGVDEDAVYIPVTTWCGDVYSMSWSADDACMTKDEWEEIKSKPKALILHPIN